MNYQIKFDNIKPLSVYATREVTGIVEAGIAIEESGLRGLTDPSIPVHMGMTIAPRPPTLHALDETLQGLRYGSLNQYTTDRNRIVVMRRWTGWDDPEKVVSCTDWIDALIAAGGENSEYATLQLGHFLDADKLPIIGQFFDPKRTTKCWCSEFTLLAHKLHGAPIDNIYLDPLHADEAMHATGEFPAVLGYYKWSY
jgi:hypothetical protein